MKIFCYDSWIVRWLKTFANTVTACIAVVLGLAAAVMVVFIIAFSIGAAFTFHWILGTLALIGWIGIANATIEVA